MHKTVIMGILAVWAAAGRVEAQKGVLMPDVAPPSPPVAPPQRAVLTPERNKTVDSIELQQGDSIKGTLQEGAYGIQTFFGRVELKAEEVVRIANVREAKPRQLITMANGEVYGGQIEGDGVTIQLSTGQSMKTPWSLISSVAYRTEGKNLSSSPSLVFLRSGERYRIETPPASLSFATQFGVMSVSPEKIAYIQIQSSRKTSHVINLRDGSDLVGFLCDEVLELNLPGRKVKFIVEGITRLQFSESAPAAANLPTLTMENKDLLVGVIDGTVKLQTEIGVKEIPGGDIVKMTKLPEIPGGVRIVMKDSATMTGQILDSALNLKLSCGLEVKAPVLLILGYTNAAAAESAGPAPLPAAKGAVGNPAEDAKRAAAEKAAMEKAVEAQKAAEIERIMKEMEIQRELRSR